MNSKVWKIVLKSVGDNTKKFELIKKLVPKYSKTVNFSSLYNIISSFKKYKDRFKILMYLMKYYNFEHKKCICTTAKIKDLFSNSTSKKKEALSLFLKYHNTITPEQFVSSINLIEKNKDEIFRENVDKLKEISGKQFVKIVRILKHNPTMLKIMNELKDKINYLEVENFIDIINDLKSKEDKVNVGKILVDKLKSVTKKEPEHLESTNSSEYITISSSTEYIPISQSSSSKEQVHPESDGSSDYIAITVKKNDKLKSVTKKKPNLCYTYETDPESGHT